MITRLEGNLIEKTPTYVVIDCRGVGYMVHISLQTFSRLPESGTCQLFTTYIVREDAHLLYGFAEQHERKLFEQLISVSGIGAATARVILSSLTAAELAQHISGGNAGALQRIKGIGAKSAQRIIVDLKDKIVIDPSLSTAAVSASPVTDEALAALVMLGFSRQNAEKALERTIREEGTRRPVEEMIKSALKYL